MDEQHQSVELKKSGSSLGPIALVIAVIGLLLSALPIINNFAFILLALSLILALIARAKSKKRTLSTIAIVLSILGLVVVLASQKMYGDALTEVGKKVGETTDTMTGKKTDELLGKSVDVSLGTFDAQTDQYGIVTTKLPAKITNKTNEKHSYSIQIEAVSSDGTRIVDDVIPVNDLGAGQSIKYDAFRYIDSTKLDAVKSGKFKVSTVSQF